jgi:hypothetical protein
MIMTYRIDHRKYISKSTQSVQSHTPIDDLEMRGISHVQGKKLVGELYEKKRSGLTLWYRKNRSKVILVKSRA